GAVAGVRGCCHSFGGGRGRGPRVRHDSSCHSGASALAPHHARPRPFFYPPTFVVGCLILWDALSLIFLWVRRGSVVGLWLMVVFCAYVLEIYTGALGLARFSAGWYASRFLGFVPSVLVLCVLLYEITTLYAQLLRAVLAQRREREARLMTGDAVSASIAH